MLIQEWVLSGNWIPIDENKLEAGPGSPCWLEYDSKIFLSDVKLISTGQKSSSSSLMSESESS